MYQNNKSSELNAVRILSASLSRHKVLFVIYLGILKGMFERVLLDVQQYGYYLMYNNMDLILDS